jgi:hypothetical protein
MTGLNKKTAAQLRALMNASTQSGKAVGAFKVGDLVKSKKNGQQGVVFDASSTAGRLKIKPWFTNGFVGRMQKIANFEKIASGEGYSLVSENDAERKFRFQARGESSSIESEQKVECFKKDGSAYTRKCDGYTKNRNPPCEWDAAEKKCYEKSSIQPESENQVEEKHEAEGEIPCKGLNKKPGGKKPVCEEQKNCEWVKGQGCKDRESESAESESEIMDAFEEVKIDDGESKMTDVFEEVEIDDGERKIMDAFEEVEIDDGESKMMDAFEEVEIDDGESKMMDAFEEMEIDDGESKMMDAFEEMEIDEVGMSSFEEAVSKLTPIGTALDLDAGSDQGENEAKQLIFNFFSL